MAVNDFNRIAPVYDRIARIIFGNQLLKAQIHFLDQIQPSDHVLILGGGSGELLEYIPKCASIDFIEKSNKMIDLAQKRKLSQEVKFINADFVVHKSTSKYDVVICPFFLDCFNEKNLKSVLRKIEGLITKNGKVIVTDFDNVTTNKLLSKLMHLFFSVFASLGTNRLLDIRDQCRRAGFSERDHKLFRKGIFSSIYTV